MMNRKDIVIGMPVVAIVREAGRWHATSGTVVRRMSDNNHRPVFEICTSKTEENSLCREWAIYMDLWEAYSEAEKMNESEDVIKKILENKNEFS